MGTKAFGFLCSEVGELSWKGDATYCNIFAFREENFDDKFHTVICSWSTHLISLTSNSETFTLELLVNFEDIFSWYYT